MGRSPRYLRTAGLSAAAVAAVLAALAWAAPPLLRRPAEARLTAAVGRPVTIARVAFNPLALRLTVEGVRVEDAAGGPPLFTLGAVVVDAEASSLLRRALVLREVRVERPTLHLVRLTPDAYNVSDLLPPASPEEPPAPPGQPPRFQLAGVRVIGGAATFEDRVVPGTHRVADLAFELPFLTSFGDRRDEPATARGSFTLDGARVAVAAEGRPFHPSRSFEAALEVGDLDLTRYVGYAPRPPGLRLTSGRLEAALTVSFRQDDAPGPRIEVAGGAAVSDFAVADGAGAPLGAARRLALTLAPTVVSDRHLAIAAVELDEPALRLDRSPRGTWNLLTAGAARAPAEPPAPAEPGPAPWRVTVARAELRGGRVDLVDRGVEPPFQASLAPVTLGLTGLDTATHRFERAELAVHGDAGEAVAVTVGGAWAPLALDGTARIDGLGLPRFEPYLRPLLPFRVTRGTAGASATVAVAGGEDGPTVRLEDGTATLADLALAEPKGAPFLRLASLAVSGSTLELATRAVRVAEVTVAGARLDLAREPDGTLSLARLAPPPAPAGKGSASGPWAAAVDRVTFTDGAVTFEDRALARPVRVALRDLRARASGLSTAPGRRAQAALDLRIGEAGTVAVKGPITLVPMAADLTLTVKALDLTPLGAYASEAARILVTGGTLGVAGTLGIATEPTAVRFAGDARLDGFGAVDEETAEALLRWGALAADGIEAASTPPQLRVKTLTAVDPYVRVDVAPGGGLNLAQLLRPPPADAGEPAPAAGPRPIIELGSAVVQGGAVEFSDRHVRPEVRARLQELTGRVTKMSSETGVSGEVSLLGRLDGTAPLEIRGTLNPFGEAFALDLAVDFRDMDLTALTPYATRYVGYPIERGKLGLDLRYTVLGRKLDSQNRIVLDRLALGDRVESPDAVKVPVKFALALLRDRNQRIDLDLPVAGSLDDPKFRIGKVVWSAVVNLLTKAVTAPFAALGALFGSTPPLQQVEFSPGSAALPAGSGPGLDALAQALVERPGLRLEVSGHAAPETDRPALRDRAFERAVAAEKLKESLRAGQPAVPVEEVTVAPEERERLIAAALAAAGVGRSADGTRAPTAEEQEALLRTHFDVGDDALRHLADRRARAVQAYLAGQGGVPEARVSSPRPRPWRPSPWRG